MEHQPRLDRSGRGESLKPDRAGQFEGGLQARPGAPRGHFFQSLVEAQERPPQRGIDPAGENPAPSNLVEER